MVREEKDATAALATAVLFLPQSILLDVMKPGITGGELAANFHAKLNLRDVPIVSLTAAVTNERMKAGSGRLGDFPFPAQPVGLTELLACLRHHQGESRAAPQARQGGICILA